MPASFCFCGNVAKIVAFLWAGFLPTVAEKQKDRHIGREMNVEI